MLHRARQASYGEEHKWDYRKKEHVRFESAWWRKEPSWWRTMMKHKKRRSAWRSLKHQLICDRVDADEAIYPLDTKPWIYYW